MKKPDKSKPTSIRLPVDLREAVEHLAKEDRRSVSSYIEIVLDLHVKKVAPKLLKPRRE
jgi:predicted DNA-binding protein